MKITLINDLSGYGNCSLTANIPVLNVMGHETHPFPTAVLSNQTAYDSFFMRDCSADFAAYIAEWDKLGEKTDCVYAGFTPNAAVPEQAADLAEKYRAIFFFDPVLGDKGELYKCFDSSFIPRYRAAAARAQYITPNLTEACILGGERILFRVRRKERKRLFGTGVRPGGNALPRGNEKRGDHGRALREKAVQRVPVRRQTRAFFVQIF